MGISKFIRGILWYRSSNVRKEMVEQFEKIRDNPRPKAILFTCMDSRVLPTRFTQSDIGDMFIIRNAGNLVPHAKLFGMDLVVTTEPAALEFACVTNKVKDIIVCGHSDCKAMNLLHVLRDPEEMKLIPTSPIRQWLTRHGAASLTRWEKFEASGFKDPVVFGGVGGTKFTAIIDPENKFSEADKLSQISALTQLQNLSSYSFLKPLLEEGKLRMHVLWFDIYTGEIYYFSHALRRYVIVNEETCSGILEEIDIAHSKNAVEDRTVG